MKTTNKTQLQGITLRVSGETLPIELLSSREKIVRHFSVEHLKTAQTALIAEKDILGSSCPVLILLTIAKIELLIEDLEGTTLPK